MRRHLALMPLAVLAGSCQGVDEDHSRPVVVVGDSIIVDTRDELQNSIPDVLVDAIWGRGPDHNANGYTFPTLRQALPGNISHVEPGGWIVVQDDGGEEPITVEFATWVEAQVPDDVCLAWVSPSNNNRDYLAQSQQNVRDAIDDHSCSAYIDWHSVATPDLLNADGLHPNQAGQYTLNHLIWSATS